MVYIRNKMIRFVVLISFASVLSACSMGGQKLVGHLHFYDDDLRDLETSLNIRMGGYWLASSAGIGFRSSGDVRHSDVPLKGAEIVAWWKVEGDRLSPNGSNMAPRYYYARSLPDVGVQASDRSFFNDDNYYGYISFGEIRLYPEGFTAEQFKQTRKAVSFSSGGRDKYVWGEDSILYYKIFDNRVNIRMRPTDWDTIRAIPISKTQYDFLDNRCEKPLFEVQCFIDENFVGLTEEQLAYVKERTHELDVDRMAGKIKTRTEPSVNIWK